MKKTLILISALLALALMLTGCAQNAPAPVPTDAPVATAAPTDAPTDAPTAAPTDAAESQPVSEKPGMLATINGKDIPIDEALKEYAYYEIIEFSALPAATVLSELTILQIKGIVSQEAGKRFTLKIK